MSTLTAPAPLVRMAKLKALCDILEELDDDTYEVLAELRDAKPALFADLVERAADLGFHLDVDESAFGNAMRIHTSEERSALFLGVEKIVTLEITANVSIVFTCGDSGTCYSAELIDRTDLGRPRTTRLSEAEIALVTETYELDLKEL